MKPFRKGQKVTYLWWGQGTVMRSLPKHVVVNFSPPYGVWALCKDSVDLFLRRAVCKLTARTKA